MMHAFSEGLVLAGESGLDQQTLLDVLVCGIRILLMTNFYLDYCSWSN